MWFDAQHKGGFRRRCPRWKYVLPHRFLILYFDAQEHALGVVHQSRRIRGEFNLARLSKNYGIREKANFNLPTKAIPAIRALHHMHISTPKN